MPDAPLSLDLAAPGDDAPLRRLLAACPMPGRVALTYEREPSFFAADALLGPEVETVVTRRGGDVVAVAQRAVRARFVGGVPQRVGYLGALRVRGDAQGRGLVARGYLTIRDLHRQDGQTPFYLTSITEENDVSKGILVDKPRPSLPAYREAAPFTTFAILARNERPRLPGGVALERATGWAEVSAFLLEHGRFRDGFPVWTDDALAALPGFSPSDVFVARRGGEIVGTLACYDARPFRQSVVRGYDRTLARLRPVANALARLADLPPVVPEIGQPVASVFAALPCVANDDPAVFDALVAAVRAEAFRRGAAFLLAGAVPSDPLAGPLKRRLHLAYRSRIYTVCWADGAEAAAAFDARLVQPDLITL